MEILKLGQYDTGKRSFICTKCGCEFVYTDEDIGTIVDEIDGFFQSMTGLKCPCCGGTIDSYHLNQYSTCIKEAYTSSTVHDKKAYANYLNLKGD